MFEGKIVPAVVDSMADGGALRVPGWTEIVARLAAAHDLRRSLALAGDHPAGNFDRFGEWGEGALDQGERLVNPDALGHGKARCGKCLPPRMAR